MDREQNKISYRLLDSGNGRKLEQFGSIILNRPCSQAVWFPQKTEAFWQQADAIFQREDGNEWITKNPLPESWKCQLGEIVFKLMPTDFGHLGIFPEHQQICQKFTKILSSKKLRNSHQEPPSVLNLFAYSGGVTLAAAKEGARVCHVDSSKGMVAWARENAQLNKLEQAPIRWIVEDVIKFLKREIKRGKSYDGIVLDPPSFGRGAQGEVFKIDQQINELLALCRQLLSSQPLFIALTCHTPGYTPLVLSYLLQQMMAGLPLEKIEIGELTLPSNKDGVFAVPSGTYAFWQNN